MHGMSTFLRKMLKITGVPIPMATSVTKFRLGLGYIYS